MKKTLITSSKGVAIILFVVAFLLSVALNFYFYNELSTMYTDLLQCQAKIIFRGF